MMCIGQKMITYENFYAMGVRIRLRHGLCIVGQPCLAFGSTESASAWRHN